MTVWWIVRVGVETLRAWVPAFAGMTVIDGMTVMETS